MITIPLSKPEAKLCRDAAKAFNGKLFPEHGEQSLSRPEWFDLARWLTWYSCDFSRRLELETRHAAERLAGRIDAAIEHWDREHPAVDVKPGKTTQRQLELA